MRTTSWAGVLVLLGACDASDSSPEPISVDIHVEEIEPLNPMYAQWTFAADLRVSAESGAIATNVSDIESDKFGVGDALTYVLTCDASAPVNRLDIGVHSLTTGPIAIDQLPAGLVADSASSIGVACREGSDTRIDYRVALATKTPTATGEEIAFRDVVCTTSRSCSSDAAELGVTCTRADNQHVELGVRDVRLVCNDSPTEVAPDGASNVRGLQITTTADIIDGAPRWTAQVALTFLAGCSLEASLIAAPNLGFGQAPGCTAWPVMQVSLPLGAALCGSPSTSEVRYAEAGGAPVALVIAPASTAAPVLNDGQACLAAPVTTPQSPPTPGDSRHGFIDLALTLDLPAAR